MINTVYDIIIIGSGIAGLYSAYKIKELNPNMSVLILEKNKKEWIGGRTNNEQFYGTEVVTGAGIVRKNKDHLLIQLIEELNIPYHEFTSTHNYITQFQPININETMRMLKKEYKEDTTNKSITFKEFAIKHLGTKKYKQFVITSGYSDYEKEDALDTLYNYGMDDNAGNLTCLSISWKELVAELVHRIGSENIKAKQKVIKINKISEYQDECFFEVETQKGVMYKCNKLIIATTISSLLNLLPSKSSIYKQIHAQTFLRLYAKFSKSSTEIMKQYIKGYTVVEGPLQKLIPMDPDKGVYMIAYSDNASAVILKEHLENTLENRMYFEDLLEKTLGIEEGLLKINALLDFYWTEGTHYYEPLKGPYKTRTAFINAAQHPDKDILVVGEVVSKHQGWVQGALESVDTVLNKKWLSNKTC
jgi:thioredoxin reductase